jgi:hypothetical protein
MKVRIPVVIIALLFGLGGLAAGVQAVQENGTTPLPQATPSNGSRAKKVDQPASKGAETPSPAQAASHQQTVSPDLEKSLVGLTEAVTKLVGKQAGQESVPLGFLHFLKTLAGAGLALLSLYAGVMGLRKKKSWFEKNKEIITLFSIAIVLLIILLASLYLLSGLVTAAFYLLFAFIMLLVALLIAATHLLTFIDNNRELKARVRKHFPELFGDSAASESPSSGDPPCPVPTPPGSARG